VTEGVFVIQRSSNAETLVGRIVPVTTNYHFSSELFIHFPFIWLGDLIFVEGI